MRPLLELGREEVRAALRAAGIAWRDDASNDDRVHARNRVRLDLLPAFRSLHPAADANLLRTAELLAEDDAALDALAARLLDGRGRPRTAAVAAAPAAVVRRALRRVAGFPAPRPVAAERVRRARALRAAVPARCRSARAAWPSAATTASSSWPPEGLRAGAPQREIALRVPGETAYGAAVVRCALAHGGGRARRRGSGPGWSLRAAAPGGAPAGRPAHDRAHAAGGAACPRSERARYPVVAVHGEPVALPGIAVAAALRRPTGLVLTVTAC